MANVVTPIKLLNIKIDHIIGIDKGALRTERLIASLDAKMHFVENVVSYKGLGMPRSVDESPHTSSDEKDQMTPIKDKKGNIIPISPNTYTEVVKDVVPIALDLAKDIMKKKFLKKHEEKAKTKQSAKGSKKS